MVNTEGLRAEVVTEEDGFQWVQIADDSGFAGYDPTPEQIKRAVIEQIPAAIEGTERDRDLIVQRVVSDTSAMYRLIVQRGIMELSGWDIHDKAFGFARRNRDVAQADKQMNARLTTDYERRPRYADLGSEAPHD